MYPISTVDLVLRVGWQTKWAFSIAPFMPSDQACRIHVCSYNKPAALEYLTHDLLRKLSLTPPYYVCTGSGLVSCHCCSCMLILHEPDGRPRFGDALSLSGERKKERKRGVYVRIYACTLHALSDRPHGSRGKYCVLTPRNSHRVLICMTRSWASVTSR